MLSLKHQSWFILTWRFSVTILLLVLAGVAGTRLGRCWSPAKLPEKTGIPLRLIAEDADLGDLWENVTSERVIRIANDGDVPIVIKEFRTSCSCTDVTLPI